MGFVLPLAAVAFPETMAALGVGAASAGSLASAGSILSLVGSGIGAVGAIKSASANAASAKYNSQVAANNAQIAQQNATWAGQEGEANAAIQEQKTRKEVGAIRASQAANNIDLNSGSAVDVRSSAAELGELDAISVRSNAARQAYGFQTQASSDMAQSQLDKYTAENDKTAGYIGAGTTLLGGVGDAATNYANFKMKSSVI